MAWKEFFPSYRLPRSLERLLQSGALRDMTSERDVAIPLEATLADGSRIVIWVDHPSADRRATLGGRYQIELWERGKGPPIDVLDSDRIEDVLVALASVVEDRGGPRLIQ